MTSSEVDFAWAAYEAAELERIRVVLLARLTDLIATLNGLPESQRFEWARAIAERSVDGELPTPIRMPLFREVLFPALCSGVLAKEPGCARWLAGLNQLLYKYQDGLSELAPGHRTEIGLLKEALSVDEGDSIAASRLIKALCWQLEYSIHEIPTGVLWGNDGATIDECEKLAVELQEFEQLVAKYGELSVHQDLIAACRLHYRAYAAYLSRLTDFDSYAGYLESTGNA